MLANHFLFLALEIMAKRKLKIDNLDDITEPIPTASLHGVIQTVSPIKKANYSEGKLIINGHSSQRFGSLKKSQQAKLKELMDNHSTSVSRRLRD